jgi:hypothetical protein
VLGGRIGCSARGRYRRGRTDGASTLRWHRILALGLSNCYKRRGKVARHPIADKDTIIHNWVAGIASQYNRSSGIRRHRRRGSSSCKGRRNDNVTLGHCAYIAIRTSNRHLIRDIRSWQQSVPLVDIVAGTVATGARACVHGSDDHSGNKGGADHDSACVPRRRMTPPPMVQLAQHRSPPPDRPRGRPPAMIPLPLALARAAAVRAGRGSAPLTISNREVIPISTPGRPKRFTRHRLTQRVPVARVAGPAWNGQVVLGKIDPFGLYAYTSRTAALDIRPPSLANSGSSGKRASSPAAAKHATKRWPRSSSTSIPEWICNMADCPSDDPLRDAESWHGGLGASRRYAPYALRGCSCCQVSGSESMRRRFIARATTEPSSCSLHFVVLRCTR